MAFDFDDMEAEAQARLAEGDDVAARQALGAAETPDEWRGGTLPPMRNILDPKKRALPSRQDLRKYLEPLRLDIVETFNTRLRLFVFPGAGDSVASWVQFVNQVPSWIDVAIFERTGHGQRSLEPFAETLVEDAEEAFRALEAVLAAHAKGGSFEGAPFALAAHSMGCQVMMEVALRLKQRMGLQPVAMFPIDRGAPHIPIYTEEGYRLLCLDEPLEFFEGFNPTVYRLMLKPNRNESKDTQRMIEMWKRDLRLCQEHLWPEGHFIFNCELHVIKAMRNFAIDASKKALPEEAERVREINCRITNSGPASAAPWSHESFDAWAQWTTSKCSVHSVDADHIGVKLHPTTIQLLTDVLDSKTML